MELIILCHSNSTSLVAKDFVPIGIAVLAFFANVLYQAHVKQNNIKDRIATEIISTCDKMIRFAIEAEYSALTMKRWHQILKFYPRSIETNKEDNKNVITEATYYHRKLEDTGIKLDMLKSDLKKSTKDLQNYWGNDLEARKIIKLMSNAVLKEHRRYDSELNGPYSTWEEVDNDYNALIEKVNEGVIFEGIGFDLVQIQKIIDWDSPTLLLSHEKEKELLTKIKKFQNDIIYS